MVWFCSFVLAVWTVAGLMLGVVLFREMRRQKKKEGKQ